MIRKDVTQQKFLSLISMNRRFLNALISKIVRFSLLQVFIGIMSSESDQDREDREKHGSTIGIGIEFITYPSNDSFTSIFTFHSHHSLEIDTDSIISNDSGRFTLFTLGISNRSNTNIINYSIQHIDSVENSIQQMKSQKDQVNLSSIPINKYTIHLQ